MDRYQRVEKPRAETPISENEIRVTTQGKMRNYITYATTLLQDKGASEIVLKAMGRAINKTVTIAEIIKRRIASLHQNTAIGSTDITDLWEPLEEGLLPLETTRHVSMITITLSTKELDKTSTGYQPPLPADQVEAMGEFDYEGEGSPHGGRGRGRGRGRDRDRGNANGTAGGEFNNVDGGWGRGHGHGQGRGGRSTGGRGGFRGHDREQDPVSYEEISGRGQGRGRSVGRGRGFRTDGPLPASATTGAV